METKEIGLLNVAQTAELLGLSQHTIRRYVLERRISFVKLGAAIRFDPCELQSYIDACRVPGRS